IPRRLSRDARTVIRAEPTAVLTPQESATLFETLRAMAEEGRTIVFISHKLNEVMAVLARVTVRRGGRSVATLPAAGATPQSLAALMVGREVEGPGRIVHPAPPGRPVLDLEAVFARGDRGGAAL